MDPQTKRALAVVIATLLWLAGMALLLAWSRAANSRRHHPDHHLAHPNREAAERAWLLRREQARAAYVKSNRTGPTHGDLLAAAWILGCQGTPCTTPGHRVAEAWSNGRAWAERNPKP